MNIWIFCFYFFGQTLLVVVKKPAMFCLHTSSQLFRPQFEFSLKMKVMGSNPGYLLKSLNFIECIFSRICSFRALTLWKTFKLGREIGIWQNKKNLYTLYLKSNQEMVQPSFNTQKNKITLNVDIGQFLLFIPMCTVHNWGRTGQKQQLAGRRSLPTGVWNRLYRGNWLTNAMCLLAFKVTTNHSELGLWISIGKWTFLRLQSEQI